MSDAHDVNDEYVVNHFMDSAACMRAKATGGGWSNPSRVLLVMDPNGVVRGVGATGTVELEDPVTS